jgi:hypothetical protein
VAPPKAFGAVVGGDHPDDLAADPERHAQERAEPLLLVDVAAGRARILAKIVGARRAPGRGGDPDDPLADPDREIPPFQRAEAVRGGLLDRGPVRAQQADAAAGAAHERGDGAADGLEHRGQVETRGDELARTIESGELLRALGRLRVQARVLDRRGQRSRHLGEHLGYRRR